MQLLGCVLTSSFERKVKNSIICDLDKSLTNFKCFRRSFLWKAWSLMMSQQEHIHSVACLLGWFTLKHHQYDAFWPDDGVHASLWSNLVFNYTVWLYYDNVPYFSYCFCALSLSLLFCQDADAEGWNCRNVAWI